MSLNPNVSRIVRKSQAWDQPCKSAKAGIGLLLRIFSRSFSAVRRLFIGWPRIRFPLIAPNIESREVYRSSRFFGSAVFSAIAGFTGVADVVCA